MELELRGRVVVATRNGGELHGVIRERWFGPITGESFVVDVDGGGMVIAPVHTVRPSSESEAL